MEYAIAGIVAAFLFVYSDVRPASAGKILRC